MYILGRGRKVTGNSGGRRQAAGCGAEGGRKQVAAGKKQEGEGRSWRNPESLGFQWIAEYLPPAACRLLPGLRGFSKSG
jgi:hypothetical protein